MGRGNESAVTRTPVQYAADQLVDLTVHQHRECRPRHVVPGTQHIEAVLPVSTVEHMLFFPLVVDRRGGHSVGLPS